MHELLFYAAVGWMTVLLVATVLLVVRPRSGALGRLLALDTLALILIAVLVLYAGAEGAGVYLDAAIALALLSFISTLAAARYHDEGQPF